MNVLGKLYKLPVVSRTSSILHVRYSSSSSKDVFYRPKGFKATAVSCGIKKNNKLDFVMISSDQPCNAAATFTLNKVCAAPVHVCKEVLQKNSHSGIQCVVINSGCANAVTGEEGMANARETATLAAKSISAPKEAIVMSTGVIGVQLDMNKIKNGITSASKSLVDSDEAWHMASQGIMTTDMFPKITSHQVSLSNSQTLSIAGIAKGAGMIHPNMATMLSVIGTDARISSACLNEALKYCVDRSFNAISVDGDTSTNDTVCVLANGAAGNPEINDSTSQEFMRFRDGLQKVSTHLAQQIVRDGEGATKFVTITIKGATSVATAKHIANSIAKSSLVKTALYGQDANWGRVLAAIGYSGIDVKPEKISLWFAKGDGSQLSAGEQSKDAMQLLKNGTPIRFDEAQALELLKNRDIAVVADLGQGEDTFTMWTCDLTYDYIKINAAYRT